MGFSGVARKLFHSQGKRQILLSWSGLYSCYYYIIPMSEKSIEAGSGVGVNFLGHRWEYIFYFHLSGIER